MSITKDLSKGIIFYDNAESTPPVAWPTSKADGYMMFTGGTQKFGDANSQSSGILVSEGFEGAPKPRSGSKCYRFRVVKRTDYPPCCEWTRAELYWGNGNAEITGAEWFAISLFIPNDAAWLQDNRPIGVAYDFKFPNAQGPASVYMKIEGGQWQVNQQPTQGSSEQRTNVGPVVKGIWTDLVLHRNFKNDSSGFVDIYMNKKLVFSNRGPNYPGGEGYLVQGIYKWSYATANGQGEGTGTQNGPISIYYDEIRMGNKDATLDSVSPQTGVITPPPIDPPPVDPPVPPVPPPTIEAIKINVGGAAFSQTWVADKYFSGGSTYAVTSPIANTVDDAIFQNERFGNFSYKIPIKNGDYTVKLHFAEIFHKAVNLRLFDVSIEGKKVITSLDIFKEAGANTALIKSFPATVTDGTLNIDFLTVKDNSAVVAIEVLPGSVVVPPPPPVDTTIYIKSFTQGTKTINGIVRPVIIITWTDNTTTTIDHK